MKNTELAQFGVVFAQREGTLRPHPPGLLSHVSQEADWRIVMSL